MVKRLIGNFTGWTVDEYLYFKKECLRIFFQALVATCCLGLVIIIAACI